MQPSKTHLHVLLKIKNPKVILRLSDSDSVETPADFTVMTR